MQFDGTGSWVGRLLIGTVLAIGALIALAAVAGAQTSGDNSDPNSGTSENSDGGSSDGGSSDGNAVDPEEARIAACASRYGGYQAGWAEQTCRYPNLVWTRTISCVVNRVYSDRADPE